MWGCVISTAGNIQGERMVVMHSVFRISMEDAYTGIRRYNKTSAGTWTDQKSKKERIQKILNILLLFLNCMRFAKIFVNVFFLYIHEISDPDSHPNWAFFGPGSGSPLLCMLIRNIECYNLYGSCTLSIFAYTVPVPTFYHSTVRYLLAPHPTAERFITL